MVLVKMHILHTFVVHVSNCRHMKPSSQRLDTQSGFYETVRVCCKPMGGLIAGAWDPKNICKIMAFQALFANVWAIV